MPYTVRQARRRTPSADELRARDSRAGGPTSIPPSGPSFPQEQPGLVTGAHWDLPEQQPDDSRRERSVEHLLLTPVFGTAQPLKGCRRRGQAAGLRPLQRGTDGALAAVGVGDRMDAVSRTPEVVRIAVGPTTPSRRPVCSANRADDRSRPDGAADESI